MIKTRIAAVAVAAVSLFALATPAYAYTPPYHIRNNPLSDRGIWIWSNDNCTGTRHTLGLGDAAMSESWDSISAPVPFSVTIWDDADGSYMKTVHVGWGGCAKAGSNIYQATTVE